MANIGFRFAGTDLAMQFRVKFEQRVHSVIARACRAALTEAGQRIQTAGRDDMKRGGNFTSPRWQNSIQYDITPRGRTTIDLILTIRHRVPFARIFEYGGIIRGKPLLWIPLPWNPRKVRARDYPGRLFRVNREGKNPLLMRQRTRGDAEALYVGVKQVRQKRRFHLRPIIRRVARQTPFLFRKAVRLMKAGSFNG